MELIYVWLEYLRPFKKHTSINLSSQFNVTCAVDEVAKTLTFAIEENPNFIPNFFEGVANVTALIGKNGTGKSSFLEFLTKMLTFRKPESSELNGYVDLFFKDETVFYCKNASCSWKIEVEHAKKYECFNLDSLQDIQTIYYSPIFDLRSFDKGLNNDFFVNVCTDDLIYKDRKSAREKVDLIDNHRFKNVERQIYFIEEYGENEHIKDRVVLPDALDLTVVKHREPREGDFLENINDEVRKVYFFFMGNMGNKKDKRGIFSKEAVNHERESLDHTKLKFYWNFAAHFFNARKLDGESSETKNIGVLSKDLEGKSALQAFRFFLENQSWTNDSGKAAITLLDEIDKVFDADLARVVGDKTIELRDRKMAIPILQAHIAYKESLPLLKNINPILDLLQVDWRNLSSGEKAFLDIFSRLFYAKQLIKEREKEEFSNKTTPTQWVYLLLDEGDLYFHPEWQRQYLNIILGVVPEIFEEIKLQIILTSHSPFVISDLPKDNVVFLKREKDELTTVDNKHIKIENTFAGNIHTLLADGFFLDDGLMGAFAQKKIKDALKRIDKKELDHKSEIEKLITIIGEPIIRQKMRQLFEEKYGQESLDEEIERLKRQLKEAENKKNQSS